MPALATYRSVGFVDVDVDPDTASEWSAAQPTAHAWLTYPGAG